MPIKIDNKIIGPNQPCFIIAEVSSNHGGKLERAKKMIEAAAWAGADAVKFQVFTAEKIAADTDDPRTIVKADEKAVFVKSDTKLIDLYKPNELPREWLAELAQYAKEKSIIFMATPFDEEAVDQLKAIHVPAYKNASYELLDVPLLRKLAKTKKPLILSTGMANLGDIEFAIETIRALDNDQIILLHCNSTYPTPPENVNLRVMKTLQQAFPNCPIGFSDHTLGWSVPLAAVTLGASVIEKHFMLNDGVQTIDEQFSITPEAFKEMVDGIRTIEKALGSTEKKPSKLEEREKVQARRSLWITKDIPAGHCITSDNIGCLRPGIGLDPTNYDFVIGKKVVRDLKAGKPLEWEDLLL